MQKYYAFVILIFRNLFFLRKMEISAFIIFLSDILLWVKIMIFLGTFPYFSSFSNTNRIINAKYNLFEYKKLISRLYSHILP